MGRSRAEEKSFYPLILCFILLVHVLTLLLKIHVSDKKITDGDQEKPLIVRIDSESRKQIVQSEDSDKRDEVDDAFLSDKTRSFDKQTKARKVDRFNEGQRAQGGQKKGTKDLKLSDLGQDVSGDPFKQAAQDYTKQKNGDMGKSTDTVVSSTNDHVEDIPLGDLTHLNTVEYKYYGFYHRIRQKLEQFWGRSLHDKAEQMAKEGRMIASNEELVTALIITLNQEGEIVRIQVKGSSGVKELDDAAIESFNQAGPFPNPPKDLVVNGTVTLEWGFVVKS